MRGHNMKHIQPNQKYGRLTVLDEAERHYTPSGSPKRRWRCQCECGTIKVILQERLLSGGTRSCGCLQRDVTVGRNTKHGFCRRSSPNRVYFIWDSMIRRCVDPLNPNYSRYGARGIRVCPAWVQSLPLFIADMGDRPSGSSIDRIDNNGPYCPFNCRWATSKQQNNNRRDNRHIEFTGETLTLLEWSDRTGISYHTLRQRIDVLGWTIEAALTTPTRSWNHKKET